MVNEEDLKKIVAEQIAFYRRAQGMTQLELAEKLHYSDKSVSKWERGEGLPDVCVLCTMAELFGVPVDTMVGAQPLSSPEPAPKQDRRRNVHLFVPLLSLGLVWLTGAVLFVLYRLLAQFFSVLAAFDPRLLFLYCVPASFIVLTVFACLWGRRIWQALAVTGIVWTVPLSIYGTCPHEVSALTFLIAAVLQVLVILWNIMKYRIHGK